MGLGLQPTKGIGEVDWNAQQSLHAAAKQQAGSTGRQRMWPPATSARKCMQKQQRIQSPAAVATTRWRSSGSPPSTTMLRARACMSADAEWGLDSLIECRCCGAGRTECCVPGLQVPVTVHTASLVPNPDKQGGQILWTEVTAQQHRIPSSKLRIVNSQAMKWACRSAICRSDSPAARSPACAARSCSRPTRDLLQRQVGGRSKFSSERGRWQQGTSVQLLVAD